MGGMERARVETGMETRGETPQTPQKKYLSIVDMGLPVINYERLNRLKQADVPIPSRWDMTWATKACLGMMLLGLLILCKRWVNKNDKINRAVAKSQFF